MPVYKGSGERELLYVGSAQRKSGYVDADKVYSAVGLLYVADAIREDLWILDVDTPSNSTQVTGSFPSGLQIPRGLASHNRVLYAVDADGDELWIVDVDTPSNSSLVGAFPAGLGGPSGMASHDGVLYVSDNVDIGNDELWSVDPSTVIGGIVSSTLVGTFPAGLQRPLGLASHNGSLYAIDDTGNELWIADVTTPANSTLVGTFPAGLSAPVSIASHDRVLYAADDFLEELWILDVDTPSNSTLVGTFPAGITEPSGMASHPT